VKKRRVLSYPPFPLFHHNPHRIAHTSSHIFNLSLARVHRHKFDQCCVNDIRYFSSFELQYIISRGKNEMSNFGGAINWERGREEFICTLLGRFMPFWQANCIEFLLMHISHDCRETTHKTLSYFNCYFMEIFGLNNFYHQLKTLSSHRKTQKMDLILHVQSIYTAKLEIIKFYIFCCLPAEKQRDFAAILESLWKFLVWC
jgi:hypothetical protein